LVKPLSSFAFKFNFRRYNEGGGGGSGGGGVGAALDAAVRCSSKLSGRLFEGRPLCVRYMPAEAGGEVAGGGAGSLVVV